MKRVEGATEWQNTAQHILTIHEKRIQLIVLSVNGTKRGVEYVHVLKRFLQKRVHFLCTPWWAGVRGRYQVPTLSFSLISQKRCVVGKNVL